VDFTGDKRRTITGNVREDKMTKTKQRMVWVGLTLAVGICSLTVLYFRSFVPSAQWIEMKYADSLSSIRQVAQYGGDRSTIAFQQPEILEARFQSANTNCYVFVKNGDITEMTGAPLGQEVGIGKVTLSNGSSLSVIEYRFVAKTPKGERSVQIIFDAFQLRKVFALSPW